MTLLCSHVVRAWGEGTIDGTWVNGLVYLIHEHVALLWMRECQEVGRERDQTMGYGLPSFPILSYSSTEYQGIQEF